MLNPAKRYCSRKSWSSGASFPKKVSLKLPSILTPQAAQDIAAVCIGRLHEGQDVDSSFLDIIINISTYSRKVKIYLEYIKNILIIFDFPKCAIKPVLGDLEQNCQKIVRKFLNFSLECHIFCAVISLLVFGFMPNLSRPCRG